MDLKRVWSSTKINAYWYPRAQDGLREMVCNGVRRRRVALASMHASAHPSKRPWARAAGASAVMEGRERSRVAPQRGGGDACISWHLPATSRRCEEWHARRVWRVSDHGVRRRPGRPPRGAWSLAIRRGTATNERKGKTGAVAGRRGDNGELAPEHTIS
eukprot:6172923-Pleurochrysis_carterae.AAC.1